MIGTVTVTLSEFLPFSCVLAARSELIASLRGIEDGQIASSLSWFLFFVRSRSRKL